MANEFRIELEQERSLGGILTTTAELYRRFPLLFAILALAVIAPYELLVLGITGYGPLRHRHENVEVWLLRNVLQPSLITPLVSALHVHAVVAIGEGRRPRLVAVARSGLSVLPIVAAAEVMANIGILLGFLALIIPGILLTIRWAVVAQTAALENQAWLDSLRRSARLTQSRYAHVFALLLLIWVVGFAVYRAVWEIQLGSASGAASVCVGIALETVIASFSALTLALLYFDLRYRAIETPRAAPREYRHLRDLE